ncbi:TPA: hypothetical protein ACGZW2_004906 [Escherichia coli]|nr:hypothetical protein [Escherichia coli]MCV1570822.1 hypothetical protein [Escherichia coli]MDK6966165.1 hypothetical protein [Escherichia coli]
MTKIAFWINIVQSARPNPATSHQPPATSHQPPARLQCHPDLPT